MPDGDTVAVGLCLSDDAISRFLRHSVPLGDAVDDLHRAVSAFRRSAISLVGAGDAGLSTGT